MDGVEGIYRLAVDEARRAYDEQRADMAKLRDRSLSLLGVGGLAATFVGGLTAADDRALGAWGWAALVLFLLLILSCIWLLWPRKIQVGFDPRLIVSWAENDNASSADADRDLALRLGEFYEQNRDTHARMGQAYCAAIVILVMLLIALLLDLGSR